MQKRNKLKLLTNKDVINSHCSAPFLVQRKDGKWSVRLKYKSGDKQLTKEWIEELNTFTKVSDKKKYANYLIEEINNLLQTEYFHPDKKRFERVDKKQYPVLHYLHDFFAYKKNIIGTTTYQDYGRVFESFEKYLRESNNTNLTLEEISKSFLCRYLDEYLVGKNNISFSTRDYHLGVLKIYFNYLTDTLDILEKSPLKTIKKINKSDSDKHKPYNDTEFRNLLNYVKDYNL